MTSPYDLVHQLRTQAQNDLQNVTLASLVGVMADQAATMKAQADSASKAQKVATWLAVGSVVVAAGSLTVAVLALLRL